MKILFTCSGPWGTGSFTYLQGLAKGLQSLGHEALIFFCDNAYPSPDAKKYFEDEKHYHIWKFPIHEDGIEITHFPLIVPDPHPRNPDGDVFAKLRDEQINFYLNTFEKEIEALIHSFKPDVIECQHIWAMASVMARKELPFFCTAHNIDQIAFANDPRMRPLAEFAATKAKKIFSLSNFVKKKIEKIYKVKKDKIVVTGSGYDKNIFYPKKIDKQILFKELNLQIPNDAFIISFAGKISRTKGIDILLKANKILGKKSKVHFLICGAGNTLDVLDENEKKAVLFDHVHILGHMTPELISRIHNIASCSIMPSRSEGFGISCLEANACGLPVIFSRCGGVEEFAVGISVGKENPKELANAVQKMQKLTSQELAKFKEEAAKKAANFSWEEIAKQRLEYYGE